MPKKKAEPGSVTVVKPVATRRRKSTGTVETSIVPVAASVYPVETSVHVTLTQDIERPARITGKVEAEVTVDLALLLTDLVKSIFGGKS